MPVNQNNRELSRRGFLKTTTFVTLGSVAVGTSLAYILDKKGAIALIVDLGDAIASAIPSKWAVGELKAALEAQGSKVRIVLHLDETEKNEYCVVVSGMKTSLAKSIINKTKVLAPTEPESLCLVQADIKGRQILLAAGTDPLGLVYALTELSDRVQCLATGHLALEFSEPVIERPASRIRSIMRYFSSEVEDKVWFYDHDYWRSYLTMLINSRINRLNFTTGMTYDSAINVTDGYMVFPFPFFFAVPGYDVTAKGLGEEERERNLAMLKFISEETVRRGLRFQFGIWTITHKWIDSSNATYQINGLTDENHTMYCRDALSKLLHEVPAISGVTFRVHEESGISLGQDSFWKTLFSSIAQCGRRVEIDLHAKNMEPETLSHALATDQPVVISPKYCGEHLGLPYHQASIRELEMVPANSLTDTGSGVLIGNRKFTRYGYADTLAENRTWDVVFRIWPGTQRFLLSGDPFTFAGYGRNASFCGAAGIELSEPLGFKGRRGSGIQGGRNAYVDPSLIPTYDFEKYNYMYRLWGRLGYNPDSDAEVWRRYLRKLFGQAALAVENSLAPVSRILPLFTIAHGPAGSCQTFWPEIYTNMPIAYVSKEQPYKDTPSPRLFGKVSPFDPQLFQSPEECADNLISGIATGKYSPLEVAQWLQDIADDASTNLSLARKQLGDSVKLPEFRRIEEDVLILIGLALFFAGKLRSAVLWRIYTITGNHDAGVKAVVRYTEGRTAWAAMAERAKGVYLPNITYGELFTLNGHWLDRIPSFDIDIADLTKKLETPIETGNKTDPAIIERVLKIVNSTPVRPFVFAEHTPVGRFSSGQPVPISLILDSGTSQRVMMHYRHINQAERWQSVELSHSGDTFQGEIPSTYTAKRYALQYYFEVETGTAEATLIPPLNANLDNVPYYIMRQVD